VPESLRFRLARHQDDKDKSGKMPDTFHVRSPQTLFSRNQTNCPRTFFVAVEEIVVVDPGTTN
jgi:hypothetical protein